jgi:N utilization substance protein B
MLYQADLREIPFSEIIETEALRAAAEPDREASWMYAREVVDGVADHATEIDELIETFSVDWSLARMPAVDRALLRLACWEILFNDTIDAPVAISEAVELAQEYSTEESARFINGVLGRVADYKQSSE